MFFKQSLFLALTTLAVQPTLAQSYINPSNIKYFYVTGGSIEWWGKIGSYQDGFFDFSNTANGPNWVEYLTSTYNWQISKWGYPGAVTNSSVVNSTANFNWENQIAYVKGQFNADQGASPAACASNSLFVITASNTANDIIQSYNNNFGNTTAARNNLVGQMLNTIGGGLNDLHAMGARNFLFQSVLPLYLTPVAEAMDANTLSYIQSYVQYYDAQLGALATYLQGAYSDSNIYYANFTQAFIDAQNGKLSGPTAGYLARNTYCSDVGDKKVGAVSARNPNDNNCPYGARGRQFMFWDNLHFTSPLHCEYAFRTLFSLAGFNAVYPSNCQYANATN